MIDTAMNVMFLITMGALTVLVLSLVTLIVIGVVEAVREARDEP